MGTALLDHFADANGANLTAHAMDVGPGWAALANTITIQGNRANITNASTCRYVADAGAGNSDVTAAVTMNLAANNGELDLRATDTNNLWRLRIAVGTTNNFVLQEIVAGTSTTRATGSVTVNAATDYAVQAVTAGTTITGTVNGGNTISYASASSNQTATKFGIAGFNGGGAQQNQFDDFTVTTAAAAAATHLLGCLGCGM